MTLPDKVIKIVNKIPNKHEALRKLIEKNYQVLNLDELKAIDFNKKEITTDFYITIVTKILSTNSEALELLKNLSVLNVQILTNIDRKSVEKSYNMDNIQDKLNYLVETGLLGNKGKQKETLEFTSKYVQNAILTISDKTCHENAVKYYEQKSKYFKEDYNSITEILYHQSEIAIDDVLAIQFLGVNNTLRIAGFGLQKLISIGEKLIGMEDKYKAPVLVALGNLYADLGRQEEAEIAYLDALSTYKELAGTYYKIYLPYVATVHNRLGKLYVDLKRFEEAEKIYLDTLKLYKEVEEKYNDIFSPAEEDIKFEGKLEKPDYQKIEVDLPINLDPEKLCQEAFKDYKEIVKEYHDVFLPDMNSSQDEIGHVYIDLDLLGEKKGTVLDEPALKKLYAKTCYDGHLADVATVYSNLGLTYMEMAQHSDAERMHLEALRIRAKLAEQYPDKHLPLLAFIQNDLAILYTHLFRNQDAEEMYLDCLKTKKELSERNPSLYLLDYLATLNTVGHFYLGIYYYDKAEKMYLEALKGLEKLTKKEQKLYAAKIALVQNNVGNANLFLGDYEKAKHYFDKAIIANPTNGDILYNCACIEALNNNNEKALELLEKAIEANKKFKMWAKTDRFLKSVKELPEFKKLIEEKGANQEEKN
ncbi:MAG: tetratricopeptide repeat protein [Candidatus Odinarchaeota archaeon]